jgi:hypothetical protein
MVTRSGPETAKILTTDVEFSDSFMLPVLETYECKSEGHMSKHVAHTLHSVFTSFISHSKVQNNAALYFNEQWDLWQREHPDRAISDSKKMFLSHIKKILFSNEDKVLDFIIEAEHKHGEVTDIFNGFFFFYFFVFNKNNNFFFFFFFFLIFFFLSKISSTMHSVPHHVLELFVE